MPLNVMDAHFRSFGKLVVPELVKEKIGVLGMKPMANGIILKSKTVTPIECLHYRSESADLRGHYRNRQPGDSRPGVRGSTYVPSAYAGTTRRIAEEDRQSCFKRRVRAIQNYFDLRLHSHKPELAGPRARTSAADGANGVSNSMRFPRFFATARRTLGRQGSPGMWRVITALP